MTDYSRRRFVKAGAGASLLTFFGGASTLRANGEERRARSYEMRVAAAERARRKTVGPHVSNGDESRYANKWASFTKTLPHDELGHVQLPAYRTYLAALESGDAQAMARIPLGGYNKLANPHAALAFDLMGPDAQQTALAPSPAANSEEYAAELVELYWQALTRDVPFHELGSNPLIARACHELTAMPGFRGPRAGGRVTPDTLFRGITAGGAVGPYVSQFLLLTIPFGATRVPQKYRVAIPGRDYLTAFDDWLAVQNGGLAPATAFVNDSAFSYMTTPRILTEYLHRDFTYQAFLSAALMLLKISAPLDGALPYQHSLSQGGFVTFGAPDILHYVAAAANCSLKAAWFHKWMVHRTARPEEIGGRVHCQLKKKADYGLPRSITESAAVEETLKRNGTALLPQAYPEGSPTHPSFPAGHAVIAGACTTVLKAWFAESWVIPTASVPNPEGTALTKYTGPQLTVGGELDKLAENISIGRNYAGVHWRCDAIEGMRLGEAFAIDLLREMKLCAAEPFDGFSLTKFDGERITV